LTNPFFINLYYTYIVLQKQAIIFGPAVDRKGGIVACRAMMGGCHSLVQYFLFATTKTLFNKSTTRDSKKIKAIILKT
jgi:hypothetical protein